MPFAPAFYGGDRGFYQGGSVSSLVPHLYSHALDGHPYLIDDALTGDLGFHHRTIPLLKQQQQSDGKLGEQSINPNGLWRSSVETWHKGAGQLNYDLTDSDPARFRTSKGVDPWTRWQISLLNDTASLVLGASTNFHLAATSTRMFLLDGTAVKYTDDLSSVSSMTGSPGTTWKSITTNGYDVWATDGTNIYHWVRTDTAVGAAYNTTDIDLLVWVTGKARLMGAKGASVYNVVDASGPSDIKPSIVSSDFTWVGFAEGPSVIYGAGYQGDKSMIFRWGIKDDGTGLDVAVPALVDGLPTGEIVYSIGSYLGFVVIGTDQGLRFALPDSTTGNLTLGALIDINSPVRCFVGQGSSVWFGWSNFDSTSSGLGRFSLTTFSDPDALVPAYASDLMATAQGNVISATTFLGRRVFSVTAVGVYAETTTKVASGTLSTGWRSFGIPDDKIALQIDVRHEALPAGASIAAAIATDGASTTTGVLTSDQTGEVGKRVSVAEITAERFEVQYALNRATDTTTGPTLTREVLALNPTADTSVIINVPFLLNDKDVVGRTTQGRDPGEELLFLETLRASRDVVTYQEASRSYSVTLEDYVWLPGSLTEDRSAFQGTAVCQLKVVI